VLVEILTCANTQEETAGHHRSGCSRRLGDYCRMDPHGGTSYSSAQVQPSSGVGDTTNDAPDKRALPLLIYPWVIVIRYQGESETCFLCHSGTGNQVVGSMLFTGEGVADLEHDVLILPTDLFITSAVSLLIHLTPSLQLYFEQLVQE
jgi:hypothetical protein